MGNYYFQISVKIISTQIIPPKRDPAMAVAQKYRRGRRELLCRSSRRIKLLTVGLALMMVTTLSIAKEESELPEVVIKGEDVLKLKSTKPRLEIPLEQNRPLLENLKTEKEILLKKPSGWEKQTYDSLPELTESPQVIIPRTHHLRGEKICSFHPLMDLQSIFKEPNPKKAKKLARWELMIADDSGQTFRKYAGQGLPPETISFDGLDENGKVLEVGYSYSTILRYYDSAGKLHTAVGNPFVIPALAHQEPKGFFINLEFKMLYQSPPTLFEKREFSNFGKELLQETADWIKKYYFTFPVNVIVHSKNKAIAEITAKEISEELANLLLRLKEEITYTGKIGTLSLEKVEIVITNR